MSRWATTFENHKIFTHLAAAKSALDNLNLSEQASALSVAETARLAKVVAYLEGVLETVDPDLFPLGKLDEAAPHLAACANEVNAFISDNLGAHLEQANAHVDAALDGIRHLVPFASRSSRAYARSVGEQARIASEHLESFSASAAKASAMAQSSSAAAREAEEQVQQLLSAARSASATLCGSDDDAGLVAQAKDALVDIEDSQEKINTFYNSLFSEEEGESKKSAIGSAVAEAKKAALEATALVSSTTKIVADLKVFFEQIFGSVSEDGQRSGGAAADLESLKGRLHDFQDVQQKRYKALNDQIESLLPGATSAGLASAYRELKESFDKPIKFFSKVFFAAITVLVGGSLILHVQSVSLWEIKFLELASIDAVLKSFVYKLPFYGPAVWLAYYATKRRSECQRLQQEYAHKEALAKSYDSYKKQIEELGIDDDSLMKSLLERAIDAVSYNASRTLDGKHGDSMPSQEFLRQFERMVGEVRKQ